MNTPQYVLPHFNLQVTAGAWGTPLAYQGFSKVADYWHRWMLTVTNNNCQQTFTLTLSTDGKTLSGSEIGCNGGQYTINLTKQ